MPPRLTSEEQANVTLATWVVLSLFGRQPSRRLLGLLVACCGYELGRKLPKQGAP